MERAYDEAKYGEFSQRPYIDMVIPTLTDPSMAPPGKHILSCFVQYAPYKLKEGTWDEKREAFGENREYLVLKLAYGDLTLMVPCDNTEEVGLREVINDEEVEEVFAVLRKKEARMPTNWSRRFKNHVEKLKSGDIYQVAEVVRNLSIREKDKGLSAGEKRMLAKARQILVSELTFALNVDEEAAEGRLDQALGK